MQNPEAKHLSEVDSLPDGFVEGTAESVAPATPNPEPEKPLSDYKEDGFIDCNVLGEKEIENNHGADITASIASSVSESPLSRSCEVKEQQQGECQRSAPVTEKPKMATESNPNRVGLVISSTHSIRVFLSEASTDTTLSAELRQTSSDLLIQSDVPYEPLRAVWIASDPSTRPELTRLLSGTNFVFSSPKPREKSEELKARLKKLEDLAERKAYQELVKDIAPKEDVQEPFSSYKDQLGFGLHVLVTMFTGYLVGYAAFRALFDHSPAMNAAGGILGLVGAMLVETFLFIIRNSNLDSNKARKSNQKPRSSFSTSSLKKNL